jgi:hypothetical protein
MLTRKDLALNDEYLNALVETSRRKDMSAYHDFESLSNVNIHTSNVIEEQQAQEEPAFTLVTKIAFPLKCRCGFSWTYEPREYDPNRRYALCPRCRQAVKINGDRTAKRSRSRSRTFTQ